ncbi:hypothetical protein M9458_055827 [Cirrhinus mrigala]|uniref:Gypsy retrotransposon integrase-like protein 1 n=1 Tax=Cirrhinus mrigala TaxID=683832 RepID=A0ABD0MKV1_CIRMR
MEDLVKTLAEVSVRQQHCFELLTEQHGHIQGYLTDLRLSAAQNVPLPDARVTAGRLLPKLTADDDIEAYLKMFESVANTEGWARGTWAAVLAPLLSGEAQRAYFSLPVSSQNNYNELKREILGRLGLSATVAAQRFHDWEYRPRVPARAQAADLMRLADHWLLEGMPSPSQVAERVVVDRMLRALPRSMRQAAGMRGPKSLPELIEAIELADATYHREAGERAPPFPRRVVQERRPPEGTPRPVHRPSSPRDEPMPTDPSPPPTKPWIAGCVVHRKTPKGAPKTPVKIKGRWYRALLDSGSAVSLVRPDTLGPRPVSKSTMPITCVHGDTRQVHTNLLTFHKGRDTWTLEVGVLKDLPGPLLLGRDWPGFEAALADATQPAQPRRRQLRAPSRGSESQSSMLTSDSGRDGESPPPDSNLFFDVFQQVTGGGDFGKAQKEDDRLKHCWGQVRVLEGQEVFPAPHPLPHFVVQNGLLYCVAERRGENTTQRIRDRFHWPGLEAEVKSFCQACPRCQRTSPRKPPPSPLIPLPIIGVPFERIGMDIVGPLPRSGRGHEHILVIVDYATRYPEAVPLRRATSKAIARELFLLSSRVGLPSEILTDQGTPFMSRLMADLCRLLKVKQVRTSVYHPQTDGLVERFNQTLKQMLRRVTTEDKKDWDLLLPYVLFGVREVPQASTGFTPFELLFGRQPRGLLDVAREAWEQQPAAYRTVIEHVKEMRAKIDQVMPLVREHLVKAQQAQQRLYNRAAQPREFQPGDRVMVLVPNAACKFLAQWQGPFTIEERVGPVNYRVRQPGRRKPVQLYHINLLKKWVGDRDQVAALTLQEPAVLDTNPDLSAAQKADLRHLVGQFLDVFSDNPGQTNVLSHDIRTPPGVIVRQRPYRVPEARRQAIEAEIQKMLKLGVIEPSRSPWSSPIVLVPKPDGTLRFCNDYRRLNEVSDFDSYPMPRVDELLERLGRARYITTLDLTKGYWQVPLSEEAKPKTAFSTPSGHWQYRTLPFGLHGAPATFQRLMDIILRPHQTYAAAYLDDLVIHSEAWEDHLERLRRVLSELRRAGLTANPRKCHLALHEARYLGFTVGRGLIKPQENKVKAILEAPKPSTKTQVRAFLGLAGYYRCFIPSFSSMAAPLTDLTRKGQPDRIRWTEEAEHAFRIIRGALTTEPVLRAPDFSCPFLLHTDASDTGLGAVLSQVQEGEEHPVVYISRKLSKAERNYAAVEKEALAIKWAVLELRYYLLGRRFTLFTDHAPLQWMARAKDTNARVTRWFLSLQDFHFDVRHRAGSSNTNADGLSRSWAAYTGPGRRLGRGSVAGIPRSNQRRPGNTQPAPGATHHEPIGHGPHPHINQQPSTEDRELSPMIRRDRLAPHFPDARTGVTALFCTHPSLDTSTRRHGRGRSHHAPTTEDADTDITRICFLTCSILQ